jgi:hypothetical protein
VLWSYDVRNCRACTCQTSCQHPPHLAHRELCLLPYRPFRRIDVYQAIMTSYIDFSQPSLWSEFLQAPRRLRKQRLTKQQYLRRALRSTLPFGSKWESGCLRSVWLILESALPRSKVRTSLISTLCILDSTPIHSKWYTDRQEETILTTFRIPQQSDYQAVRR